MQTFEFVPVARPTSRVGFGCARLVGRTGLRSSARMVETALALGIRYFDVAPSYGMGTAEEVLGEVIGSSRDVIIATKVGVPRPEYSERANAIRAFAKSVLNLARPIRSWVLGARRRRTESAERPRYDFSPGAVRASLETSLRLLRRSSVDVFLAHEPHPLDLHDGVSAGFEALQREGLIGTFGVGIGGTSDRWSPFGTIWQSAWPGPAASDYATDVAHIWHGAIRSRLESPGARPLRPSSIVREVLEQSPSSIVLVSASTPERLRELLASID